MALVYLFLPAFFPALLTAYAAIKYGVTVFWLAIDFFAAFASIVSVALLQYAVHAFIDPGLRVQPVYMQIVVNSMITAALIEEGCKAAVFALFMRRYLPADSPSYGCVVKRAEGQGSMVRKTELNKMQRSTRSMLLLAVCFGFVFSGFENLSYFIRFPNLWLLRFCTAAVLHGTLAVFYVRILQAPTKRHVFAALITAVALHGLYNIFVALGGWFMLPAAAVTGITSFAVLRALAAADAGNEQLPSI